MMQIPTLDVPYRSDEAIERAATALLTEFATSYRYRIEPPIPLDDIVSFLGLRIDFDNLENKFGFKDAHGALWVSRREIYIDESIVPEDFPNMEGRFNFSVGHEIGHWSLHRPQLEQEVRERRGRGLQSEPQIICRRANSRERIELQADHFSAFLIMPTQMVYAAWAAAYGEGKVVTLGTLDPRRERILVNEFLIRGSLPGDRDDEDNILLEAVARPLAEQFRVSPTAMRIRLENMGLLSRQSAASPQVPG